MKKELTELEIMTKDRDHWKANHDHQVIIARILKDRTDMPLERVKAHGLVGLLLKELEQQNALLLHEIEQLKSKLAEYEN